MALRTEDKVGGPAATYPVRGNHGTLYTVIDWKTGQWSCDCPDWTIRRSKLEGHSSQAPTRNHCKHVRACLRGEFKPAGVAYLVPAGRSASAGRAISLDGEEV